MKKAYKIGLASAGIAVLAAGAAFGVTNFASADDAAIPVTVAIDAGTQQMTVKGLASKVALVGYTTSSDGKVLAAPKEDTYENTNSTTGFTVDLSHLNFIKDNYITIRGAEEEFTSAYVVKLGKRVKVNKSEVKYTADGAKVKFKAGAADVDGTFEYRTAYGNYGNSYTQDTAAFKEYFAKGATLIFRKKAAASISSTLAANTELKVKVAKNNEQVVKAATTVETVDFAGDEVKVKIAKQAAAPNITVDYTKQTIKFANEAKVAVRVFAKDATTLPEFPDINKASTLFDAAADKGSYSLAKLKAELGVSLANGFFVQSYVPVASDGKKPESAVKTFYVKPVSALPAAGATAIGWKLAAGTASTATTAATAIETPAAPVSEMPTAYITTEGTAAYGTDGWKGVSANLTLKAGKWTLNFKNTTADSYKFVVVKKSGDTTPAAPTAIAAPKVGTDNVLSITQVKKESSKTATLAAVKNTKANGGGTVIGEVASNWKDAAVYVFREGDKTAGTWVTGYTLLGTIAFTTATE